MGKQTLQHFNTCAGTIEFVTIEQFIDILCTKSKQNIDDKIVAVEVLGLENDGKSPIINKTYIDYGTSNPFFTGEDDDCVAFGSCWRTEKIKLVEIDGNYRKKLAKNMEKVIYFSNKDIKFPLTVKDMLEIAEDLSIKSMNNFGEASHFIDFGGNKYAVVALDDIKIESCVYNKQVRAGIIIDKVTAFGIKVKEMK